MGNNVVIAFEDYNNIFYLCSDFKFLGDFKLQKKRITYGF